MWQKQVELEQIVAPRAGAWIEIVVYTLISSVDEVDRKLHKEEPFNFIGAVSRFFERGTTK